MIQYKIQGTLIVEITSRKNRRLFPLLCYIYSKMIKDLCVKFSYKNETAWCAFFKRFYLFKWLGSYLYTLYRLRYWFYWYNRFIIKYYNKCNVQTVFANLYWKKCVISAILFQNTWDDMKIFGHKILMVEWRWNIIDEKDGYYQRSGFCKS